MVNEKIKKHAEEIAERINAKLVARFDGCVGAPGMVAHEYFPKVEVSVDPADDSVDVKYANTVVWTSAMGDYDDYDDDGEFDDMIESEVELCAEFMAIGAPHLHLKDIFQAR